MLDDEQRALHTAAMSGHAEFMMILLEKGADVNICDDIGNTPLHVAIINVGDVKVVETLIKRPTLASRTVMVKYHKIDAVRLILSQPQVHAIISDHDNEGYTPLHLAVTTLTQQKNC